MKVHPIVYERAHVNIQRVAQTVPVDNWHVDSTPFVLVTVLTDHEDDTGGSLLVRTTKCEVGEVRTKLKRPGQAILMQGSQIWHCAEASRKGKRLTMVTSFFCDSPSVYDTTSIRIALLYSPPLPTLTQYIEHALGRIKRGADALLRKIVQDEKGDDSRDIALVLCLEISKLRDATFEIASLLARGQTLQIGKRVPEASALGVPLMSLASAAQLLGRHLTFSHQDHVTTAPSIEWTRALCKSATSAIECARTTMAPVEIETDPWFVRSAL